MVRTNTGAKPDQRGLTLVELMIAMAVGVLLLLGVSLLFTQNRQSYRQNEELARIQENARFAIDELSRDLSMAGFFAEIVNVDNNDVHDSARNNAADCGQPGVNWLYNFAGGLVDGSVRIADQVTGGGGAAAQFSCIDAGTAVRPDTDVIGIRRTGGVPSFWNSLPAGGFAPACDLTLPAGAACQRPVPDRGVFVRENSAGVIMFHAADPDGVAAADTAIPLPFEDWEYTPRVYYVADVPGADGEPIPSLCRQRLDNTLAVSQFTLPECLVRGVEDLQIELGIDTDGDGAANAYLSNPDADDMRRAVSVRLYLLMRAIDIDVGYTDERTYTLGNTVAGPYRVGPFNDRFHRRVYTTTVSMRNLANVRQLGF